MTTTLTSLKTALYRTALYQDPEVLDEILAPATPEELRDLSKAARQLLAAILRRTNAAPAPASSRDQLEPEVLAWLRSLPIGDKVYLSAKGPRAWSVVRTQLDPPAMVVTSGEVTTAQIETDAPVGTRITLENKDWILGETLPSGRRMLRTAQGVFRHLTPGAVSSVYRYTTERQAPAVQG